MLYLLMAVVSSAMVSILMRISEKYVRLLQNKRHASACLFLGVPVAFGRLHPKEIEMRRRNKFALRQGSRQSGNTCSRI